MPTTLVWMKSPGPVMERADQRGEDVDDYGYDGPSTYYMTIESVPGENQNTTKSHYE